MGEAAVASVATVAVAAAFCLGLQFGLDVENVHSRNSAMGSRKKDSASSQGKSLL